MRALSAKKTEAPRKSGGSPTALEECACGVRLQGASASSVTRRFSGMSFAVGILYVPAFHQLIQLPVPADSYPPCWPHRRRQPSVTPGLLFQQDCMGVGKAGMYSPGPRVCRTPGGSHLWSSSPQTSSSRQVQPMPCTKPPSTCVQPRQLHPDARIMPRDISQRAMPGEGLIYQEVHMLHNTEVSGRCCYQIAYICLPATEAAVIPAHSAREA